MPNNGFGGYHLALLAQQLDFLPDYFLLFFCQTTTFSILMAVCCLLL